MVKMQETRFQRISREPGSVLLMLLPILVITAGVATHILGSQQFPLHTAQVIRHSQEAAAEAFNRILETPPAIALRRLRCGSTSTARGRVTLTRSLCALVTAAGSPPGQFAPSTDLLLDLSLPGIISTPCPMHSSGRSPVSGVSTFTCRVEELELRENRRFSGNVEIEDTLEISRGDTSAPITVMTVGALQVTGTVQLNHPALILAFGDVDLDSLQMGSSAEVTVVSIFGSVRIRELRSTSRIRVHAARGVNIPDGEYPESSLLPPLLDRLPVMLTSTPLDRRSP